MEGSRAADDSDEALMQAYGAGTASAFDTLYARHKGGVYRYLVRHCRDAAIADELFQDVWMSAIRVRASYSPTAKFTTWLYTLAHNRMVDHWRATGRVRLVSVDNEEDGETSDAVAQLPADAQHEPQVRAESRELGAQLSAALHALPPEQRDAFLLQYEGGLSLGEIAQLTGVGIETAKSRLRYALTKLRGALGPLREEWT